MHGLLHTPTAHLESRGAGADAAPAQPRSTHSGGSQVSGTSTSRQGCRFTYSPQYQELKWAGKQYHMHTWQQCNGQVDRMEQGVTLVNIAHESIAQTHKTVLVDHVFRYMGTLKLALPKQHASSARREGNVAMLWCDELAVCTSMPTSVLQICEEPAKGLPAGCVELLGKVATTHNATEHILKLGAYVGQLKEKRKPPPAHRVSKQPQKQAQEAELDSELEVCFLCKVPPQDEADGLLLCCDGPKCDNMCHMHCLGLTEEPEGDWLCPPCSVTHFKTVQVLWLMCVYLCV